VSDEVNALVIAAVGVLGTLSASIVTQISSARTQLRTFEMQGSSRKEEYCREQEQVVLSIKRSCYIGMMANSRRYRLELMNYLYAVKSQTVSDSVIAELEEARRAYSTSVSETELTADAAVLTVINSIDEALSDSFQSIKEHERAQARTDNSFAEIIDTLKKFWDLWPLMQQAMRRELLTADASTAAKPIAVDAPKGSQPPGID
jgi:hypothetical protein